MGIATSQESVYERLRASVLNGEFRAGSMLAETALAEIYGVSRTPIRQALQALEKEGTLQRNGRRLMVKVTTLDEVVEVYDCRIVLEGTAAGWAARRRTEGDLVLLEHALEAMEDVADYSPLELSGINHTFHDRLWRTSHNATLVDLLTRLKAQILRFPERTVAQPGRWAESIDEHSAILQAVKDQDEEQAVDLARKHMIATRDLRLRLLRDAAG